MYDVIIIGAGPAGLTAATNTAHRGLKTLVIEQYDKPGGQPLIFYPDKVIKDHPGFPVGIIGKEFARLLEMQARNAGAEIKCSEEAVKIEKAKDSLILKTNNAEYESKRIILSTGLLNVPNKLSVLSQYKGENVHYAIKDLKRFKDKKVIVVGGGDNAFDSALQLKEVAEDVKIIIKHGYAKAKEESVQDAVKKGIKIYYNCEFAEINEKDGKLESIKIIDTKINEPFNLKADEIFSAIGFSPVNKFLSDNAIEQNTDGSIKTDKHYETSIKGLFAAGDVNGEVKLIAVACARGIEAAINAFTSIKKPYWLT